MTLTVERGEIELGKSGVTIRIRDEHGATMAWLHQEQGLYGKRAWPVGRTGIEVAVVEGVNGIGPLLPSKDCPIAIGKRF